MFCDDWIELHGDRRGNDDQALIGGVGRLGDRPVMVIGHQKGRDTKENVARNFGMATPGGYRKAMRLMDHADRFRLPILSFIDTGAYAGLQAEEQGQGEAIAVNLREMFRLRVPVIATVIGEGGSGGALGIGVADRLLMFEHSVYTVASPEACASILWRDAAEAPEAAAALKITGLICWTSASWTRCFPNPLEATTGRRLRRARPFVRRSSDISPSFRSCQRQSCVTRATANSVRSGGSSMMHRSP